MRGVKLRCPYKNLFFLPKRVREREITAELRLLLHPARAPCCIISLSNDTYPGSVKLR